MVPGPPWLAPFRTVPPAGQYTNTEPLPGRTDHMPVHRVSKETIEDDLKRILRSGQRVETTVDLGGEVLLITAKATQKRAAS